MERAIKDKDGHFVSDAKGTRWRVDEDVFDLVKDRPWTDNGIGYAKSRGVYLHRLICPEFKVVDHINRNVFDCRRQNLREGKFINSLNGPGKKSKYGLPRGVSKNTKGFCSRIIVEGKRIYIGTYETIPLAKAAVIREAKKHGRGEFYR